MFSQEDSFWHRGKRQLGSGLLSSDSVNQFSFFITMQTYRKRETKWNFWKRGGGAVYSEHFATGGSGQCKPLWYYSICIMVEWNTSPLEWNLSWSFVFMEALCKPGSYSPTGMEPCFLCTKGYYQTMEGQRSCLECSPTLTTPGEGSNSSMQCAGVYFIDIPCTCYIRCFEL